MSAHCKAHCQYVGVIYSGPHHHEMTSSFIEAYAKTQHFQAGGQNSSVGMELDHDGQNFASSEDKENGWFFTTLPNDSFEGNNLLEATAFREGFHKDSCKLQVVYVRWRT